MNERFRFRAWNFYANQMDYDSKYGLEEWLELEGLDAGFGVVSVMQCTGLKDRNGKLIYESDIVKRRSSSILSEIIWEHAKARFHAKRLIECTCFHSFYYDKIEVVGNRFENPELLK